MSEILEEAFGDVPEPVAMPDAPEPDGPARGPDGKFVTKSEPEPALQEPAPQPEAPQPAVAQVQPDAQQVPHGYVPVSVVQELRNEIKALRQPPADLPPPPDPYEDTEGYREYVQQERDRTNVEWSFKFAVQQHGEELAQAARTWGAQRSDHDPVFYQSVIRHPDPIGYLVGEYQRDRALQTLSDPQVLNTFLAWQRGQTQPAPAAVPAAPQQPTPPRSLASLPNAGGGQPGHVPLDDGAVFKSVLG